MQYVWKYLLCLRKEAVKKMESGLLFTTWKGWGEKLHFLFLYDIIKNKFFVK